jgi:amino acid transporter
VDSTSRRSESDAERADRNLTELLGELRVALPGVQVLFAFLLVVPFNQRFPAVNEFVRVLYFVTLLLTAAAAVFLIAPSFHHRLRFRRQEKEQIVLMGNALAVTGLTLLALAMTCVVLLVIDFLFGNAPAAIAAAGVALLFGVFWYTLPWHWVRKGNGNGR